MPFPARSWHLVYLNTLEKYVQEISLAFVTMVSNNAEKDNDSAIILFLFACREHYLSSLEIELIHSPSKSHTFCWLVCGGYGFAEYRIFFTARHQFCNHTVLMLRWGFTRSRVSHRLFARNSDRLAPKVTFIPKRNKVIGNCMTCFKVSTPDYDWRSIY